MTTYDDKTVGIHSSGGRFILPNCIDCDDLTFKASFIVESNVKCTGKITALFDLIVIGDVEASEIDVKGSFLCIGKCKANNIVVYDGIWSEEITAASIETNSRIMAQEIKAETIIAEGSILVARTLDIDSTAESRTAIICGETAFGAGMISAPIVFTGEPLDLDDGDDAVITKDVVNNQESEERDLPSDNHIGSSIDIDLIQIGEDTFKQENNYCGYLDFVISKAHDEEEREKFKRWKTILLEVERNCHSIDTCIDAVQLIWLSEVASSDYFRNWSKIDEMFIMVDQHFVDLMHDNAEEIICTISSYSELLKAMSIIYQNGDIISGELCCWIYGQLISNLGLRYEFVYKRLSEKGWKVHAE